MSQGVLWLILATFIPRWSPPLGLIILLQGVLAAVLSKWNGLAVWWLWIQLLLPVATITALAFHISPYVYLVAFLVLWLWYWHTGRTQVPFYPSNPAVWRAVAAILPVNRTCRVVDIGSGLGGLALYLARHFPHCAITGVELSPLPWLFSWLRVSWLRACFQVHNLTISRRDYATLNLADFDVVFAYLSPAAMPSLWDKVQAEMRSGSVLLSYEFDIPLQPPDEKYCATDMRATLYAWYI